MNEIVTQGTM